MRGLTGKVAVLAGGAGGIGTATSVRLAEEGALVMVGDLDGAAAAVVADRITAGGGRAQAVQVDVSDEASVQALMAAAVDAFGGIDALHVNAADLAPATIFGDTDALTVPLDLFDHTIAVDLRGHLLCTRHALPHLLERGGGAIVYTSSAAAFVGEPLRPSYAMAKSGVNALARHVASAWGKQGIRANCVAPGLVLHGEVAARSSEELRSSAFKRGRSNRMGTPEDVAAMVTMLLSDDASWVNGQVISVDGGSTIR
jgi:NAD(P)-dependent dehydrogenase (short-subunit alcohol dehydrogenase family)